MGRTEDGEPIAGGIGADRTGERPQRVLVVEDDPGTRELVRQALESNGFAVDVAPDGRRALEIVAADPPAAMVLDVVCPASMASRLSSA